MLTLCLLLLTSTAPAPCVLPNLMLRNDTSPRSKAFEAAAKRFDHATADWKKRRYVEAAHDFLNASALFAADGAEKNWKYALQNAVMAFEAAGKLDEAGAALEGWASKDAKHAVELRAAAAKLISRVGCQ